MYKSQKSEVIKDKRRLLITKLTRKKIHRSISFSLILKVIKKQIHSEYIVSNSLLNDFLFT